MCGRQFGNTIETVFFTNCLLLFWSKNGAQCKNTHGRECVLWPLGGKALLRSWIKTVCISRRVAFWRNLNTCLHVLSCCISVLQKCSPKNECALGSCLSLCPLPIHLKLLLISTKCDKCLKISQILRYFEFCEVGGQVDAFHCTSGFCRVLVGIDVV